MSKFGIAFTSASQTYHVELNPLNEEILISTTPVFAFKNEEDAVAFANILAEEVEETEDDIDIYEDNEGLYVDHNDGIGYYLSQDTINLSTMSITDITVTKA